MTVAPSSSARNLGVISEKCFNFEDHIKSICKSSRYHIRNIAKIRKYIDEESARIVVHAFVAAKLNSYNSLLYGLPQHLISRLQSIQNTATRVVTRTRKYDHITPVLKQLHWLPVRYRIVLLKFSYWFTKLSMEQRTPKSVNYLSATPLNDWKHMERERLMWWDYLIRSHLNLDPAVR